MRALFKTSLPLRWVVTSVAIRMGNHLPSLVFLTFCNDFFVTHGAANRLHNAAVSWGGWLAARDRKVVSATARMLHP